MFGPVVRQQGGELAVKAGKLVLGVKLIIFSLEIYGLG
jgi:hypothetical protein